MAKHSTTLYKWEPPTKVIQYEYAQAWRVINKIVLRGFIFTLVIALIVYLYFKFMIPPEVDFDLTRLFLGFISVACLLLLTTVLEMFIFRFCKISYELSESGISWQYTLMDDKFLEWNEIEGYWLDESPHFPKLTKIVIKTKDHKRTLVLPDTIQASEILKILNGHITQTPPSLSDVEISEKPPLSSRELLCFLLSTIIYSAGIAYCFRFLLNSSRSFALLVLLLLLVPGPIGILVLRGFRFLRDKTMRVYLIAFTMVAFVFFFLFIVLLEFHELIRSIKQAS
ncbi:MAG: hypothetical protein JXA82_14060 [Sedimentisphaerales bacterium]|nr:hypothetical protein [Sedimentisphaerales bacterium]